jgi:hypothetical protein
MEFNFCYCQLKTHAHNDCFFFWTAKKMTTIYRKLKRKGRAAFSFEEFKEHGWWIQGERGPSAAPKHCAKLFIGKEPIKSDPQPGLEVCAGTILSISIGASGQEHFYITTPSAADTVTKVTYMLRTTYMLQPVSQTSKAKDLLERLDTVATWWMQVPPAEQWRRQTMSQRGEMTPPEQHASIERIYAVHRAVAQQFWAPTS